MKTTRRSLLIQGSRFAAALAAAQSPLLNAARQAGQPMPGHASASREMAGMAVKAKAANVPAHKPLFVDRLEKFVDPLPTPPVARPAGMRAHTDAKKAVPFYRIVMRETPIPVHRDLPPTPMWSYGDTVPGPTIEARSGEPIAIDWVNALPAKHFLPIDHTLHGAMNGEPDVRTAVHVHGAKVPPQYDGFPEDWQTPGQTYEALYPLEQDAATLWYHDHAMGIERLNQYAGLFGFFLVRDANEDALGLPRGKYEIPLVFADRLFSADASLYYPDSGDPDAPWVPEVYGDAMMVNGRITPYLDVEPRAYRFRMLNAANSRTFVFSLSNGQRFHQIGSDQGLLAAPVDLNQVSLSPGERADVVIDFSAAKPGERITFNNQSWELMQFRVSGAAPAGGTVAVSGTPRPVPLPAVLRAIGPILPATAVKTRMMILREYMSREPKRMLMLLNATRWHEPITEQPELGTVEIWSFANTTADIHPIHLHLVRFQVLDRQGFDADEYLLSGKMNYLGPPVPPPPGDRGWKDTVQTYGQTVTRIVVPFDGYAGKYVWHCHLLEHAANEMMRPFEVVGKSAG